MAVEPLALELQEAGFAMRTQLDAIGLKPQGLMWLHFPDLRDWRLTVVSDLLPELGRARIYALLGDALDTVGPVEGLTIFDLHLAAPDEVVTSVIEQVFEIELGDNPTAVELVNCTADGEPVDAFIYRMQKPRIGSEVKRAAKAFTAAAQEFAHQ